jgi:hypothetical protein
MAAPVSYRTSRPVRLLLYGLGSVLTLLMVLWGSAQALDALSIEEESVASSYLGVQEIDLRHAHGNVDLVRAQGRRTIVAIDARHGLLSAHDREDTLRGGVLRLRGSCDFLTFGTCEEDYRIEVPSGVTVKVKTSAGETTASGLRGGDLELRSSAGPVTATGIRAGELVLSSNAGPVKADGVRARRIEADSRAGGVFVERSVARRVEATSSAGKTQIELLRPPLSVEADTSAGGVTVWVPDVGYAVDAHTSAGEEDVQVRQRPASGRKIVAESSAGDVSVLPLRMR